MWTLLAIAMAISQQVLVVFVGREMIGAAGRPKDFDPPTVMRCLGDLVLVGKPEQEAWKAECTRRRAEWGCS